MVQRPKMSYLTVSSINSKIKMQSKYTNHYGFSCKTIKRHLVKGVQLKNKRYQTTQMCTLLINTCSTGNSISLLILNNNERYGHDNIFHSLARKDKTITQIYSEQIITQNSIVINTKLNIKMCGVITGNLGCCCTFI